MGVPFAVVPSRYEEPPAPDYAAPLGAFVTALALNKATEVAERTERGYVIGADTLVTIDPGESGRALGKPHDSADAERMLQILSGRVHYVYTGVAIVAVDVPSGECNSVTATVRTTVRFRTLDKAMIADYVATGEPMDKAGAYGAQGYAAPFIESFEGDFYNVVGLPICTVGHLFEQLGFHWWSHRRQLPELIG